MITVIGVLGAIFYYVYAHMCMCVYTVCVCALQTVEQQLDKDSKLIYPTHFIFAVGKELRIKFHNEVSGWQLAMESSNKV